MSNNIFKRVMNPNFRRDVDITHRYITLCNETSFDVHVQTKVNDHFSERHVLRPTEINHFFVNQYGDITQSLIITDENNNQLYRHEPLQLGVRDYVIRYNHYGQHVFIQKVKNSIAIPY
jgi:hypothetical protein